MLSRSHRFHGYNSLRHVYKHGDSARGPLFAVKSQLNPRRKDYRVAVVVSRKVSKSAVARNRMRRRLYELIREVESEISQPFDIVITVYHEDLAETDSKDLRSQLRKQFRAAGVIV
jgi:ribonuclease P protein component